MPGASTSSRPRHRPQSRRRSRHIDLSWKSVGSTSRVGAEYQALSLPTPGAAPLERSDELCEQVWDPSRATDDVLEYVRDKVPPNKKEEALVAVHERGYVLSEELGEAIRNLKPTDGSDWPEDMKEKYRSEIFRLRKDLAAVGKELGVEMKYCLAYYLGKYKKSDNYRILKTVCVEEKNEKTASMMHDYDACAVCGEGGSLIICDGCEGEYHIKCLRPPLREVPEGHWECDECVNRKFLASKDYLMRHTGMFETIIIDAPPEPEKKRKAEDTGGEKDEKKSPRKERGENEGKEENEEGDERVVQKKRPALVKFQARPEVLDFVKEFAMDVTKALVVD